MDLPEEACQSVTEKLAPPPSQSPEPKPGWPSRFPTTPISPGWAGRERHLALPAPQAKGAARISPAVHTHLVTYPRYKAVQGTLRASAPQQPLLQKPHGHVVQARLPGAFSSPHSHTVGPAATQAGPVRFLPSEHGFGIERFQ